MKGENIPHALRAAPFKGGIIIVRWRSLLILFFAVLPILFFQYFYLNKKRSLAKNKKRAPANDNNSPFEGGRAKRVGDVHT